MGMWARLRTAWRSLILSDFKQFDMTNPPPVTAGVAVTPQTALTFSAFWNAVDIISSQVALLPRVLYKRLVDDERERAVNHATYWLLVQEPNRNSTPFVFWQTLMQHTLAWGNGYAEIERSRTGAPLALHNVMPDQIDARVENGTLYYVFQGSKRIAAEDVIHVPGMGYDGIKGYSVVEKARQSLGVGIASDRFAGSFLGNGAVPGVVLEHPKTLSPEAQKRLKISWLREHGGPDRQMGVAIAEEGMKVNVIGMRLKDAEFLASREFSVVEVARWFNIPPHKLKHRVGERPGGNLEASQTEFLTDTLLPWLVRIEQECNRKLLPLNQRSTFYVEHLINALLRPTTKERAEVERMYFDMGVLDAEAIAKLENLPKPKPKPKPEPEPEPEPQPPAVEPDEPQADDERMRAAYRALLVDAVGRFGRREAEKVKRAARKPEGFAEWLEEYYRDEPEMLAGLLAPAVGVVLASRGVQADPLMVSRLFSAGYVEVSKDQLLSLPARDLEAAATRMLGTWLATRPAELAERVLSFREGAS